MPRMKYQHLLCVVCAAWGSAAAQPDLLPSIGIGALPVDSDPICVLPTQTPPIISCGRPEGEQAADFTLFDIFGNAFHLEDALLQGKPVLMISSSYTCPVFRSKVGKINQLVADYSSQLTIVIVYTPEAHPYLDISPYFGAVNTGQTNTDAGILYEQPETYGERKAVLQALLDSMQIDAPIYLDGPCNEWWDYYGPQPNNAYLIDTDGSIHTHHDWFDKLPEDIDCDIEDLLALPPTGDCGGSTFGGTFTLQMMSNDTIWGDAGATITGRAALTNIATEDCLVRIVKLQVSMPAGWTSSLCADVCYLPDVDTAIVQLPANSTMDFYYYFYTTTAGTGHTRVGFRNESDFNNGFMRDFWAIASEASGVDDAMAPRTWSIAPNPARSMITAVGDARADGMLILDAQGRVLARHTVRSADISLLAPGLYLLHLLQQERVIGAPVRFVKE